MKFLWVIACALGLATSPAFAETADIGYAVWNVAGNNVYVEYMLPTAEMHSIIVSGSPLLTVDQTADYVLTHLAVQSMGRTCPAIDQGEGVGKINTLAYKPGLVRFEVIFRCPDTKTLMLSDTVLTGSTRGQVDLARVITGAAGFTQHLFTRGSTELHLASSSAPLNNQSILSYLGLGISHTFRRIGVLAFAISLLFLFHRRRDFLVALAALAAGYAAAVVLSLLGSVVGRFASPAAFNGLFTFVAVGAGVALTLRDRYRSTAVLCLFTLMLGIPAFFLHAVAAGVAVLGVAILTAGALVAPGQDVPRTSLLIGIPFLFALLDGLVFSRELGPLALPTWPSLPLLAGFNIGAILGVSLIPACLIAAWFLIPAGRRITGATRIISDVGASGLIACGLFWFISQLYV